MLITTRWDLRVCEDGWHTRMLKGGVPSEVQDDAARYLIRKGVAAESRCVDALFSCFESADPAQQIKALNKFRDVHTNPQTYKDIGEDL